MAHPGRLVLNSSTSCATKADYEGCWGNEDDSVEHVTNEHQKWASGGSTLTATPRSGSVQNSLIHTSRFSSKQGSSPSALALAAPVEAPDIDDQLQSTGSGGDGATTIAGNIGDNDGGTEDGRAISEGRGGVQKSVEAAEADPGDERDQGSEALVAATPGLMQVPALSPWGVCRPPPGAPSHALAKLRQRLYCRPKDDNVVISGKLQRSVLGLLWRWRWVVLEGEVLCVYTDEAHRRRSPRHPTECFQVAKLDVQREDIVDEQAAGLFSSEFRCFDIDTGRVLATFRGGDLFCWEEVVSAHLWTEMLYMVARRSHEPWR